MNRMAVHSGVCLLLALCCVVAVTGSTPVHSALGNAVPKRAGRTARLLRGMYVQLCIRMHAHMQPSRHVCVVNIRIHACVCERERERKTKTGRVSL